MVPVPQRITDVGGVSIRLDQPGQHIERSEDLKRPVDSGPSDRPAIARSNVGHELFGGERVRVPEDGIDDGCARQGQAVSVLNEDGFDFAIRQHLGRWCFGGWRCMLNHNDDATTGPISIGPLPGLADIVGHATGA